MSQDKLYELAFAFRKAKLWNCLYDSELFAVTLPDGGIGYCSVMGAAGEHLAIALYVGNKGLDSFRLLQEVDAMQMQPLKAYEVMLSQECLQCSFEGKDMLSPEELSAVRAYAAEHRIAIRGANAFPQFLSYRRASYPLPVSEEGDIRQLCAALEAGLEISRQLKTKRKADLGFSEGLAYNRSVPLLTQSGGEFTWGLHPLPPKQREQYPEPVLRDDLLLARLRRLKKRNSVWVCDVVLVPQPIMDGDAPVPVFPYTLLLAVCESEMALPTEIIADYDSGSEKLLRALGGQMLEHGLPREIRVVDERTYALLKNLTAALKIKLVLQEENALLDEMEINFWEYTSTHSDDEDEDEYDDMGGIPPRFVEMLLMSNDEGLLSMPDELWDQLCFLAKQGMLDEALARRLRGLSGRRR